MKKSNKYAVAVIKGEAETILGVFLNEKDADTFASENKIPRAAGLQLCFCGRFDGRIPVGNSIRIRNYYNA